MADTNLKVQIQFEATGDKQLAKAFTKTAAAQEKLTRATDKNTRANEKNQKGGALTVRNNRLLSNTFATLRSKILLAAFAVTVFSGTIGRLIKSQSEQELAEKKLQQALGHTSQALLDHASALQEVTTFGDEAIIEAEALLAAFIKDEEQLKKATEATLDLAAAKGMDLKAAADLVGKSIGSCTNALSRYGIHVKGAAGSTQRLESAVQNISILFGGQAKAQAQTISGAMAQFGNEAGDVAELIGKDLAQSFVPMIVATTDFLKELKKNEKVIMMMADGIRVLAASVIFLINPFKKAGMVANLLGKNFKWLQRGVMALKTALFGAATWWLGVWDSNEKTIESNKAVKLSYEEVVAAGGLLAIKTPEMIKQQELLFAVQQKARDAAVRLNAKSKEEQQNLKAGIGIRDEMNKKFGLELQLNREFTESLDLQSLAFKNLTPDQELYLNFLTQAAEDTQKLKDIERERAEQSSRLNALSQLGAALQQFAQEDKALTVFAMRLQQIAAVASAYAAANKYLEDKRPIMAGLVLAQGLANAAIIEQQVKKARAAETGADFITQGRQMLMVGDNPSGREHVQVTPLGNSRTSAGGSGSRSVNVNISGNVLGTEEFVRDTLIPEIENTIERNLA